MTKHVPLTLTEADFGKAERVDIMSSPPLGRPAVVLCIHTAERHVFVELDDLWLDALVEGRSARDDMLRSAVQ